LADRIAESILVSDAIETMFEEAVRDGRTGLGVMSDAQLLTLASEWAMSPEDCGIDLAAINDAAEG
jgi:hypothetical protein